MGPNDQSNGRADHGAVEDAPWSRVPGGAAARHGTLAAILPSSCACSDRLLALSLLFGTAPFAQPAARAAALRVAIIVGPAGSFTDLYRARPGRPRPRRAASPTTW